MDDFKEDISSNEPDESTLPPLPTGDTGTKKVSRKEKKANAKAQKAAIKAQQAADKAQAVANQASNKAQKKAEKKAAKAQRPFYKKWWVWGLAAFIGVGAINGEKVEEPTPASEPVALVQSEASNEPEAKETKESKETESSQASSESKEIEKKDLPVSLASSEPAPSEERDSTPIEQPKPDPEVVESVPAPEPVPEPDPAPEPVVAAGWLPNLPLVNQGEAKYILNTSTYKFHSPYCSSVKQMSSGNMYPTTGTREDVLANGFVPCKRCNP